MIDKGEAEKSLIPKNLIFAMNLYRMRDKINFDGQILMFNRIEPALPLLKLINQKTLFVHSNTMDLQSPFSQVRWKYFPGLYYKFEKSVLKNMEKIFVVQSVENQYKQVYPELREKIFPWSGWFDNTIFFPHIEDVAQYERREYRKSMKFDSEDKIIIFVGRLDKEKDPLLLFRVFSLLNSEDPSFKLVIIGDGYLKRYLEKLAEDQEIIKDIRFLGAMSQKEAAKYLRISDVFLLTSAFETIPLCVIEALACGLPVVTTNVGEVNRYVIDKYSGKVVEGRDPKKICNSVIEVLREREHYTVNNCVQSVMNVSARKVLLRIYDEYYKINFLLRNKRS